GAGVRRGHAPPRQGPSPPGQDVRRGCHPQGAAPARGAGHPARGSPRAGRCRGRRRPGPHPRGRRLGPLPRRPPARVPRGALPPVDGARLQAELAAQLARIGARPRAWKAFPIRTYAPGARVAAPRALLVGDAAGCDALMGEGISFALEYGMLAADAIVAARASEDWSFRRYTRAVERGPLGR